MRRFAAGEEFYTDWMEVGDNQNAVFRALPIDWDSSPTVSIKFYTKNYDETGQGTVLQTASTDAELVLSTTSTKGTVVQEFFFSSNTTNEGFKELLRYKISVTGTGWLLAELMEPIFFEKSAP